MIELILLAILIFIGILWFRNLSDNFNKEENPNIEKARNKFSSGSLDFEDVYKSIIK